MMKLMSLFAKTVMSAALVCAPHLASASDGVPTRIGECVDTKVEIVVSRLQGVPGSGSAIRFVNGGYQVSYDQIPAVDRSRQDDPVSMCLVSIPTGCPPGDARGRFY